MYVYKFKLILLKYEYGSSEAEYHDADELFA